jgi:hypothetical protein
MKTRNAFIAMLLLACSLSFAPITQAAEEFKGTWSILNSKHPGKVRLGLAHRMHGGQSQHESDWPVSTLQGLDLSGAGKRDVTFSIERAAGRFDCEGYLKNGEGAGIFRFTPDPQFAQAMGNIGFTGIDGDKQFAMAVHDVTVEFARSMQAEKLSGLDSDKLIALKIFDVTPQFIREMRAEGLPMTDSEKPIAFRVHGVTSAMAREVRASGLDASEDTLIAFRVHNVSPEFIAKIDDLGYKRPNADQLIAMRVHDVTPEFISDMRSRGLKNLSIDQLINLRVHGID